MSSEIFSTARVIARQQLALAKQLQKSIELTARSIKKTSDTIAKTSRLMSERANRLSREIAANGSASSISLQLNEAQTGNVEFSGFTREDISELADIIKKNTQLLETKSDIDSASGVSYVSVGLEEYQSHSEGELSGFEKHEITDLPVIESYENKKILELGRILSDMKSQKDIEYTELLIVSFGILSEPVWSLEDMEIRKHTRRKIERIDGDLNLTVFEKINKLKDAMDEYSKNLQGAPEGVDIGELDATYKALCQMLGEAYNGDVPASLLKNRIEEMTQKLLEIEEKEYIADSIAEAFAEEGILLDSVKTQEETSVFYMEEADDCELIVTNIGDGFLMETVGLYEEGNPASEDDKKEMKKNAKKVCEKYKKVIKRLEDKGIIIDIVSEDDPEKYLKINSESAETFKRRKNQKQSGKKPQRRSRRRTKPELRTFD